VLASLNHPHIAQIHGLDEANGTQFLVLELVDGETLDKRIARGAIPLDETLGIAKQIAEALEAAHEKGIIHRDLKPGNIALTKDGTVKVLDFGLAKPIDTAGAKPLDLMNSPTITSPAMMTGVGVILGTAAYMSPEQAKGRAADKRSDLWAFGCVVSEMLTGKRPFVGEDVGETLAFIMTKAPDWAALPPHTPATLRTLLRRCLEKDPKRRLDSAAAARLEIDDALTAPVIDGTLNTADLRGRPARAMLPWAIAIAFAIATAVSLWAPWRHSAAPPPPAATRLDLDLGARFSPTSFGAQAILSPDGARIVFVASGSNGTSRLLTRRMDQSQVVELPGSEGAYAPFFSPDGLWVAFFARGKLRKTQIDGLESVVLCDAPAGRGGAWGADGNIIAALDTQAGLSLIPAAGGQVVSLTALAPGENSHRWPHIVPGGKVVLFTSNATFANFDEASVSALSLPDHKQKIVLEHVGMYPRYVASGHLIYVTKGTLFAVPFDAARIEVRGRPAPVVEDVASDSTFGFAKLDVAGTGMLLYSKGRNAGLRTIHWMDDAGRTEPLAIEPAIYQFPRISPDGSRVIWMMNQGPIADLWIYDWQRGSKTRLTDGKTVYGYPAWSPDGRYVVFHSPTGIFWTHADGAGKPQPLIASQALQWPSSFTPDGRRLVFSEITQDGALVKTVGLDGSSGQLRAGKPELFLQTASGQAFPAFSMDGRWLAYADGESGRYEVYVRAFPDKGTRWPISNGGGTMPVWSRNGRELFYRTEDNRIMVARFTVNGDTFVADKPRLWSEKRLADTGLTPNFDLAPDGKRFAVLMSADAEGSALPDAQSHVTLVMNLFDELRRVAPVRP
jgi:serine/threonine-protein kinase